MNYWQANVCTIRVVVHGTQMMVSFEKVPGHSFFKQEDLYILMVCVFKILYRSFVCCACYENNQ